MAWDTARKTKTGAPARDASQRSDPLTVCPAPAADFAALRDRLHVGTPALQRLAEDQSLHVRQAGCYESSSGVGGGAGLPARLRGGLERLSGFTMDDVRVHRGSPRPARIGALAFAQGNQIHLAPGQERHLPHEAWHAVQQKQGRVRATMQAKGIAVNADPRLEREADAMGRRAAALGPTADDAVDTPTDLATARAPDESPVQREVGFEFETGWLVERDDGYVFSHFVSPKKKEPVGTAEHVGFQVEADEAADGEVEIEFVVYPPVAEGKAGWEALDAIMRRITEYGRRLETAAAGSNGKPTFSLDKATGRYADRLFRVTPHAAGLKARPQITAGLDLAKFGRMSAINDEIAADPTGHKRQRRQRRGWVAAPSEMANTLAHLDQMSQDVAAAHPQASPQLHGLLVQILSYLLRGANGYRGVPLTPDLEHYNALVYPKQIGEPILARTNFARLFEMLPARERRAFQSGQVNWVNYVLAATNAGLQAADSVIGRGLRNDENDAQQGIRTPALTIQQWLTGLLQGTDRLAEIGGTESLGALKKRIETVGVDARTHVRAGIFEIRDVQNHELPLVRWAPFALEAQQYITTVHLRR